MGGGGCSSIIFAMQFFSQLQMDRRRKKCRQYCLPIVQRGVTGLKIFRRRKFFIVNNFFVSNACELQRLQLYLGLTIFPVQIFLLIGYVFLWTHLSFLFTLKSMPIGNFSFGLTFSLTTQKFLLVGWVFFGLTWAFVILDNLLDVFFPFDSLFPPLLWNSCSSDVSSCDPLYIKCSIKQIFSAVFNV